MRVLVAALLILLPSIASADELILRSCKFFDYLTGRRTPTMVTYNPSELDPRRESGHRQLKTSSIRSDLEALRSAFDGLVLYGYHEASTPRILSIAKDLKFRAVLLAVWDPRSADEIDGVAQLANDYTNDIALGVLIGNDGLTFNRYEEEDLLIANRRLRARLPVGIPCSTSEPLAGYQRESLIDFGDFLAPNIHPVFDRPNMEAKEAAEWVRVEAAALARRSDRPVLVKETGFPHDGRNRYTPELQMTFWHEYTAGGLVAREGTPKDAWRFHGVAHEAFDSPWKGSETKPDVEKNWGMLSKSREPYPAKMIWDDLQDRNGR
jgi:exo-beta-1,3-glucanase (GH17 family)